MGKVIKMTPEIPTIKSIEACLTSEDVAKFLKEVGCETEAEVKQELEKGDFSGYTEAFQRKVFQIFNRLSFKILK